MVPPVTDSLTYIVWQHMLKEFNVYVTAREQTRIEKDGGTAIWFSCCACPEKPASKESVANTAAPPDKAKGARQEGEAMVSAPSGDAQEAEDADSDADKGMEVKPSSDK